VKIQSKEERLTYLHEIVCDLRNEVLKKDPAFTEDEVIFLKEMLGLELLLLFKKDKVIIPE
jgi:hypothetical protein